MRISDTDFQDAVWTNSYLQLKCVISQQWIVSQTESQTTYQVSWFSVGMDYTNSAGTTYPRVEVDPFSIKISSHIKGDNDLPWGCMIPTEITFDILDPEGLLSEHTMITGWLMRMTLERTEASGETVSAAAAGSWRIISSVSSNGRVTITALDSLSTYMDWYGDKRNSWERALTYPVTIYDFVRRGIYRTTGSDYLATASWTNSGMTIASMPPYGQNSRKYIEHALQLCGCNAVYTWTTGRVDIVPVGYSDGTSRQTLSQWMQKPSIHVDTYTITGVTATYTDYQGNNRTVTAGSVSGVVFDLSDNIIIPYMDQTQVQTIFDNLLAVVRQIQTMCFSAEHTSCPWLEAGDAVTVDGTASFITDIECQLNGPTTLENNIDLSRFLV